jgi:hypothetical protein
MTWMRSTEPRPAPLRPRSICHFKPNSPILIRLNPGTSSRCSFFFFCFALTFARSIFIYSRPNRCAAGPRPPYLDASFYSRSTWACRQPPTLIFYVYGLSHFFLPLSLVPFQPPADHSFVQSGYSLLLSSQLPLAPFDFGVTTPSFAGDTYPTTCDHGLPLPPDCPLHSPSLTPASFVIPTLSFTHPLDISTYSTLPVYDPYPYHPSLCPLPDRNPNLLRKQRTQHATSPDLVSFDFFSGCVLYKPRTGFASTRLWASRMRTITVRVHSFTFLSLFFPSPLPLNLLRLDWICEDSM